MARTLDQWLEKIEAEHPQSSIELGLGRMRTMLERLRLAFEVPVIIVGGTNGKGSTCFMLEAIYRAQGLKVATHTSPHMLRFAERARFDGREVDDETLAQAFEAVEAKRGGLSLTYFESTALAILLAFQRLKPDVVVLEIGLGGRLDAINAIEPAASIVTSVGVEHETFLGTTREAIGWEKAHIFRPGRPAVGAEAHPPKKLLDYAEDIGARLYVKDRDYAIEEAPGGVRFTFGNESFDLPRPALAGANQLDNAAGALAVVCALRETIPVTREAMARGLETVRIVGRFETVARSPLTIIDVGHNPHAARVLVKNLADTPVAGRTIAVFGMLKDKDMTEVIRTVGPEIDNWFVSGLPGPRGASAQALTAAMLEAGVARDAIDVAENITDAYERAARFARPEDKILIFGSFVAVTPLIERFHR